MNDAVRLAHRRTPTTRRGARQHFTTQQPPIFGRGAKPISFGVSTSDFSHFTPQSSIGFLPTSSTNLRKNLWKAVENLRKKKDEALLIEV